MDRYVKIKVGNTAIWVEKKLVTARQSWCDVRNTHMNIDTVEFPLRGSADSNGKAEIIIHSDQDNLLYLFYSVSDSGTHKLLSLGDHTQPVDNNLYIVTSSQMSYSILNYGYDPHTVAELLLPYDLRMRRYIDVN